MRSALARLHEERPFDVAVLHGKPLLPVWKGIDQLPLVADICDADSMRIRQRSSTVPLRRRGPLRAYAAAMLRRERAIARATPFVSFISARDRDAVVGPSAGAVVIPNGVDLEYWHRSAAPDWSSRKLVFTGVMDYGPNEDAALLLADEVLPLVQKQVPEAEALVVGRDPRPVLRECSRRPDVTVTGFVEDIRPYLEQAGVFVAPIRFASGQQNKVLEAMAMEVTVVTTPVVAEGMEIDGQTPPLAVADHAGGVAGTVVRLFRDDAERRHLAAAGRRFVEQHAIWSRSAEALERLCFAAAGAGERR
jgi:glycosyltransferase involved in cell wall biosynthesis